VQPRSRDLAAALRGHVDALAAQPAVLRSRRSVDVPIVSGSSGFSALFGSVVVKYQPYFYPKPAIGMLISLVG
jgi:hypothetical protein